jgi:chemotaxis protein methyltransferase CheR
VTREQEEELCNYLRTHTGIVIQEHQRDNLHDTLQRAVVRFGYAQAGDYIQRLHECSPDSEELEFLMANVTVGESYFFRDKSQMEFLRTGWLPQLMARKKSQPRSIRIWSAGCSHGQEIYSMAIMLHEALPNAARWNLQLHATDINAEALSAAVAARYSAWSFRATPEAVCERHFKRVGNDYQLQEEMRSMVNFSYLNLVEDEFPMIAGGLYSMDLILCRNVFIYFDVATVVAVMKKFARCLAPGGLLVLGGSDLINTDIEGLELQQAGSVFYYRRTGTVTVAVAGEPEPVSLDDITDTDDTPDPAPRAEVSQDDATPEKENTIETVARLAAQQCWAGVLEAADRYITALGENTTVLLHKAGALASLGRLEEAEQLSRQVTLLEPMEKYAHFLNALVLIERDELGAAENGMRKSLYIDPRFLEAHYQLGLLQLRQGRHEQGVRSLMNALDIAATGDPEHAIHGAPEMTYRRMTEVLRREIEVYSSTDRERSR